MRFFIFGLLISEAFFGGSLFLGYLFFGSLFLGCLFLGAYFTGIFLWNFLRGTNFGVYICIFDCLSIASFRIGVPSLIEIIWSN